MNKFQILLPIDKIKFGWLAFGFMALAFKHLAFSHYLLAFWLVIVHGLLFGCLIEYGIFEKRRTAVRLYIAMLDCNSFF